MKYGIIAAAKDVDAPTATDPNILGVIGNPNIVQ
jgi:hypothetical protein